MSSPVIRRKSWACFCLERITSPALQAFSWGENRLGCAPRLFRGFQWCRADSQGPGLVCTGEGLQPSPGHHPDAEALAAPTVPQLQSSLTHRSSSPAGLPQARASREESPMIIFQPREPPTLIHNEASHTKARILFHSPWRSPSAQGIFRAAQTVGQAGAAQRGGGIPGEPSYPPKG